MISLKRGAWFIKEALRLIINQHEIWCNGTWFVKYSLILAAWTIIPITLIVIFGTTSLLSFALIGFFCAMFLYFCFIVGNISNIGTILAFNHIESPGGNHPTDANMMRSIHWKDVLQYSLAFPGFGLLPSKVPKLANSPVAIQNRGRDWINAHFLLVPIISLENLSLTGAIQRVKGINKSNLWHIHPGIIKVSQLLCLFSTVFILVAISLGIWVGMSLVGNPVVVPVNQVMADLAGAAVALSLVIPVIGLFTMVNAIYFTCLYRWLISLEGAGDENLPIQIPTILARTLQVD